MRIPSHDLQGRLQRQLLPAYLISGDEPLQVAEAADAVRHHARDQGYASREILEVDARFDWERLAAEANSLSLFAERRILDLRIPSGKPGNQGAKALSAYCERPPEDSLLLLTLPKLDKGQLGSRWFKALDRLGGVIQIWPIEGQRLPPWIEQRMRRAGLTPAPGVVAMLAERVEGNLLAANQEIEKLLLANGPGVITPELLAGSVADSARFDVFALVDSALAGKVARALRILDGLRGEGTAAAVVLWALARELRTLCSLAAETTRGRTAQQAVGARREIWDKRKPLVSAGLQRLDLEQWHSLLRLCCTTDRAIKGQERSDPWLLLQQITARMAGAPAMAPPHGNP